MGLKTHQSAASPNGTAIRQTPSVFKQIRSSVFDAAIWDRQPLAFFQDWPDTVNFKNLPQARLILRTDAVKGAIAHLCNGADTPNTSEREMFEGDIAALAHIFADVAVIEYTRFHLAVFYGVPRTPTTSDEGHLRLICTYCCPQIKFSHTVAGSYSEFSLATGVPMVFSGRS